MDLKVKISFLIDEKTEINVVEKFPTKIFVRKTTTAYSRLFFSSFYVIG